HHRSTQFIFRISSLLTPSAIQQSSGLMSANVGDTVTLQCFYEGNMAMHFSWYKQPLGEKPQVISTVYRYDEAPTFYHEFKGNPRYSVQSGQGINHLSISDINSLDSALYYCGSAHSNVLEFGKGTFLNIKDSGSNSKTVVEQPVSESVQPGDSVTLNCTIHTETCAGEYSVYWFRHGSGESHPGIIYTHGDRSDQCEKSPEAGSPTQSCVYNLLKRNLNLSDAGTYYCAVALCGEILFGEGTKLDIQGKPLMLLFIQVVIVKHNVEHTQCASRKRLHPALSLFHAYICSLRSSVQRNFLCPCSDSQKKTERYMLHPQLLNYSLGLWVKCNWSPLIKKQNIYFL
uniref:Ig-like domain-containing protein n=1 Tax=Oncorhynchus tshawytscha TaxID=74940 RepID=A0A8C8C254_ONCTS